ncbi:MAG: hypothetical protein ACIAQU_10755 [Phycisphaerales bacterium JB064]
MDHNNQGASAREPVDRDLLISRVVDDAASPADWEQLRALAEYDPSVWRELFEAQHAQAELAQAVQQAIAIADGIDAPIGELAGPSIVFRFRQVASWAGWAVAASVAVFWMAPHVTSSVTPVPPTNGDGSIATGTGSNTAPPVVTEQSPATTRLASGPTERDLAPFTQYVPRGWNSRDPVMSDTPQYESQFASQQYQMVSDLTPSQTPSAQPLAEMPDRVLLEVRPLPNGQVELIYVRRLIEKTVINENDLYQVKPDDAGVDRTVPYRTRRPSSGPI